MTIEPENMDCPIDVLVNPLVTCEHGEGLILPNPVCDDGTSPTLAGALLAARTLAEENPEVSLIVIRLKPGWTLVNGRTRSDGRKE